MAWIIHDVWYGNCTIVPIIVLGGVVPLWQPIWVEGYLPGVRLASFPAKSIPAIGSRFNFGSCKFAFVVAMWLKRDNIFALLSLLGWRLFVLVMVMFFFYAEQTDLSSLFSSVQNWALIWSWKAASCIYWQTVTCTVHLLTYSYW